MKLQVRTEFLAKDPAFFTTLAIYTFSDTSWCELSDAGWIPVDFAA
jgi:hypothetical protein